MVYIVLVNYNGWKDTVECLESLFRLRYDAYRIIVCDNGSTDASVELIQAWAEGQLDACIPLSNSLRRLSFPPIPKPVRLCELHAPAVYCSAHEASLILIRSERNLGFAGGNNLGLRYALSARDMEFVWLLNNDAVADPDSLTALVRRFSNTPATGICGSTMRYYHRPDWTQLLGGKTSNTWLGLSRAIGAGTPAGKEPAQDAVERAMDYVYGASMLVSRQFLQEVGLLNEAYFIYCEELDWVERCAGRFRLAYAPDSIVYHRGGGSTDGGASSFSAYHFTRSWLLFTRCYHLWRMPSIVPSFALRSLTAFLRGDQRKGWAMARGIRDGCLASTAGPATANLFN